MEKSRLKKLLSGMCCSECRHDFDEDSITIKRQEEGLTVVALECKRCGKSFGVAFLGMSEIDIKDYEPLEVVEGPEPISYDDVIDAHRFIKNLKNDWSKYLPH